MYKSKNGITLIALVITIIVLLILAGVSIAMLTGENGLLSKAADSKTKTEDASAKEQLQVQVLSSFGDDGKLDLQELKTNLGKIGITANENAFPVNVTLNGVNYVINENGSLTEKDWIIAWVYKNSNWSNPYFKDKALEDSFEFEDVDTTYSLNSEDELTGQIVAKLYSDGELNFSGVGTIVNPGESERVINLNPWCGHYYYIYEGNSYYGIANEDSYLEYLENHITSINIEEGITGISWHCFYGSPASTVYLPSTLENIDSTAFMGSEWMLNLFYEEGKGYFENYNAYVDVEDAGGHTWKLEALYNDG